MAKAPSTPVPERAQHAPRPGPKPEFTSLWQLFRAHPLEAVQFALFGGERARFFHAPVRWLFGRDLLVSMRSIALYSAFGDELDHRDWMSAQLDDLRELPCEEGAFWFDFIADTGDGQLAMYDIASLLLSDLHLDGETVGFSASERSTRLPRGRFVFFGGDTAYHVSDTATLESHVCTPFAWALFEKEQQNDSDDDEHRYAYGIPGNHDYYDSLIGFNRLFRSPGSPLLPLADYRRRQHASFIALRLPFDFLFLGLDSQKGKLDRRQRSFMRRCMSEVGSDRLIVATPEPSTVFDSIDRATVQPYADLGVPRPFCGKTPAFPEPQQLHLDLSGDVHHYARYADAAHPNYASIVAGGGGAFVHPTHTSHYDPDAAWPPPAASLYPPPEVSRTLITSRLLCPWRILRGGGVFLLGALFSLLVYLGAALSPDLQQYLVIEKAQPQQAQQAPDAAKNAVKSPWELGSAVAQNLGRVLDREGGEHYRSNLLWAEWLTLGVLLLVIAWASIQSPRLFSIAMARDERRRERVYATRYMPLCAAAMLSLCTMGTTYYLVSRAAMPPLRPFLANFLLFAYLTPFPLALFWTANYLASMAKQAKVRLMHAIDSAPRWIALLYGVGSAVFGLLSYGVNSVAAFATDLCALVAFILVTVAPMIFGYTQGAGRSLQKKLGYLALGALFGQLQLWLPLAIAVYGSAKSCLLSAAAATAIAGATSLLHRKHHSAWLMLSMWLVAAAVSLLLALVSPSLRAVNGYSATLALLSGGTFACIWFGFYLAVAVSFGAHNNEAGGAACADYYRHFVRIKLERDRLTGYVIGFDEPARAVMPVAGAGPTIDTLRPRLIDTFSLTVKS